MNALPNVVVRFSSDSVLGEYTPGVHGSVIIPTIHDATPEMKVCEAYNHKGKCSGCRACWSKEVAVIAYPVHGAAGRKVIQLKLAA